MYLKDFFIPFSGNQIPMMYLKGKKKILIISTCVWLNSVLLIVSLVFVYNIPCTTTKDKLWAKTISKFQKVLFLFPSIFFQKVAKDNFSVQFQFPCRDSIDSFQSTQTA